MPTFRADRDGPLLETLAASTGNRTQVKQWLKLRRIAVNGVVAERHDHPLKAGDAIEVGPPRKVRSEGRAAGLPIMFEDDAVLVADKPAGLLTVATDAVRTRTAYYELNEYLKRSGPTGRERVFIVHRLDRDTSGLIVFAKTEEAKRTLQATWASVEKRYFAVVEGVPVEPAGTIRSHLVESAGLEVFSGRPSDKAKLAVTHYEVVRSAKGRSLLEVRTETGRKHQIRVHLADLGHPIVGDDRYGDRRSGKRLGLHASYLKFRHPETGEPLEFRSDLPGQLAAMLR